MPEKASQPPITEPKPWLVTVEEMGVSTPVLVADLDRVDANLQRMARFAASVGASLRPHAKSHKSCTIAQRQIELGAVGVCASTIAEADILAASGINNITLAYPVVGKAKLTRLLRLADKCETLQVIADSVEVVAGYSALATAAGRDLSILIEIDTGMHRTGCSPEEAVEVAKLIATNPRLRLLGILTHAGHAHDTSGPLDIGEIARQEVGTMKRAKALLEDAGFSIETVSAGSTLTTPFIRPGDGITELRPGTYAYNDIRTLGHAACTIDSIALSVVTTVVSVGDNSFVVDAGSKTLTMSRAGDGSYGYLPDYPDASFTRLSEEHGVLALGGASQRLRVGDLVEVYPIHVCVCVDLQRRILGRRGHSDFEFFPIDAFRTSN